MQNEQTGMFEEQRKGRGKSTVFAQKRRFSSEEEERIKNTEIPKQEKIMKKEEKNRQKTKNNSKIR